MAKPPRSMALNPARAPDSLPMGVRAPARMTEPGMDVTSDRAVRPDGPDGGRSPILREEPAPPPGRTGTATRPGNRPGEAGRVLPHAGIP